MYATPPKERLELAKAQSMTTSSAAQVGGKANMISETLEENQVREMLAWLRDFL